MCQNYTSVEMQCDAEKTKCSPKALKRMCKVTGSCSNPHSFAENSRWSIPVPKDYELNHFTFFS
jgi:hypothetical protein